MIKYSCVQSLLVNIPNSRRRKLVGILPDAELFNLKSTVSGKKELVDGFCLLIAVHITAVSPLFTIVHPSVNFAKWPVFIVIFRLQIKFYNFRIIH